MSNRRTGVHLTPDVFVDLLEGTPVEAERRLHLSECRDCRRELGELEQTLGWLTTAEDGEEPRVETRSSRPSPGGYRLWVAAAAVLVAFLIVLHRGDNTVVPPQAGESEMLLPPIDEDEDFRLLLALSEATEENDFPDDWYDSPGLLALDPSGLTASERQDLLEKLAEDLRSSS